MIKTFKTSIFPTQEQVQQLEIGFGTRRWVWNWALAQYEKNWEIEKRFTTAFTLTVQLNQFRKTMDYDWLKLVSSRIYKNALEDFGLSLRAWCKYLKSAKNKPTIEDSKSGKSQRDKYRPKFQRKHNTQESFRVDKAKDTTFKSYSHTIDIAWTNKKIKRLPLRTEENLEFLNKPGYDIKLVTISKKAGKYFAAITYERTNQELLKHTESRTIGIDLGIKTAVVGYDGENIFKWDIPESISKLEKKWDDANRKLSCKTYTKDENGHLLYSKSYLKQKLICDKIAIKIADIRKDWMEKLTTNLVQTYTNIKVDDFSFKGYVQMQKKSLAAGKHKRARQAYRVAPCMLKQKLEWKAQRYSDCMITYIPKGTPTTQTCSSCGHILSGTDRLDLSDRIYACPECGNVLDRDVNAAINVYNYK